MWCLRKSPFFLVFLFSAVGLGKTPEVEVQQTEAAFVLDGRADEAAWSKSQLLKEIISLHINRSILKDLILY